MSIKAAVTILLLTQKAYEVYNGLLRTIHHTPVRIITADLYRMI